MYPKIVAVLWKNQSNLQKTTLYNSGVGTIATACFTEEEVTKQAAKYVQQYSTHGTFDSVTIFQAVGTAVPVPIEIKPISSTERL